MKGRQYNISNYEVFDQDLENQWFIDVVIPVIYDSYYIKYGLVVTVGTYSFSDVTNCLTSLCTRCYRQS